MTDVKINANLTEAIQVIADKLGLTAKEIIPEYTRLEIANGVILLLGGLVLVIIPWIILGPIVLPEVKMADGWKVKPGDFQYFCYIVKWLVCGGCTIWGGIVIVCGLGRLCAPTAHAIERLLDTFRRSCD